MTTLSVDRASTPTATSRRSASARASWVIGGLVLLVLAGIASVAFGVRSVDALDELAKGAGLIRVQTVEMPANNHVLVWRRT